MEQTLVILKGDAVQRQLVGGIVQRFEQKGLKIAGLKMLRVTKPLARKMYAEHEGKDFYEPLVEFITASPVVAAVLCGNGAIAVVRKLMGPAFGPDAPAGTIRGDFGMSRRYNLVHGSDSPEAAEREIPLFFAEHEILGYELPDEAWIYARKDGELI